MKYALTLIAGYLLPSIAPHVNLDIVLGIVAGVLLGLLLAMLFVGPTPTPKAVTLGVNKTVRKAKNYQMQHGVRIFNYPVAEWSAA